MRAFLFLIGLIALFAAAANGGDTGSARCAGRARAKATSS
jgi:hypothetical protein